jgi:hypothetical protein
MASLPVTNVAGEAPRPLLNPTTGEVTSLAWLKARRVAAEATSDARRAAELRDLLEVVRPKPALTLRDTAPAGVAVAAGDEFIYVPPCIFRS